MNSPRYSDAYHHISKNRALGHPPIPLDDREWPAEWVTTYFKTYPRSPGIVMPDVHSSADFFEMIARRSSRRDFMGQPLALRGLSLLLKYACGLQPSGHRAQPSGGGRFPVEAYPLVFLASHDLPAGLYHYNVKRHALDVLLARDFSESDIDGLFFYPWAKGATLAIVLTAVFGRTQDKYGERGYRYVLLEAGHIGQNIYLAAEALGLKCCALGSTSDTELERLLDIDGITESVVYGLVIGK